MQGVLVIVDNITAYILIMIRVNYLDGEPIEVEVQVANEVY